MNKKREIILITTEYFKNFYRPNIKSFALHNDAHILNVSYFLVLSDVAEVMFRSLLILIDTFCRDEEKEWQKEENWKKNLNIDTLLVLVGLEI